MIEMFGRQWFGPHSQIALDDTALTLEALLRSRKHNKAEQLVHLILDDFHHRQAHYYFHRQLTRLRRLRAHSVNTRSLAVAFTGFWPDFNPANNELIKFLTCAAQLVGRSIKLVDHDADILIFSCFGNCCFEKHVSATRFLYLGENVRPIFDEADYSLTFDMSSFCGRNIYLPLWILRSNLYAATNPDYLPYSPTDLERDLPVNDGSPTIAYIGNNSTPSRAEAIQSFRSHGWHVECYGSQTRPVQDKIKTLRKHRYNLCFENSFTPGYVTEKLIDSFLGGAISIYWGGAPKCTFNNHSYYECDPYLSISQNIDRFLESKILASNMLPGLLNRNAFNRINNTAIFQLSKILMDLF